MEKQKLTFTAHYYLGEELVYSKDMSLNDLKLATVNSVEDLDSVPDKKLARAFWDVVPSEVEFYFLDINQNNDSSSQDVYVDIMVFDYKEDYEYIEPYFAYSLLVDCGKKYIPPCSKENHEWSGENFWGVAENPGIRSFGTLIISHQQCPHCGLHLREEAELVTGKHNYQWDKE